MLKSHPIILRPLRYDDLKQTLRWRNDPEIKASSIMHPFPVTFELEEEWYATLNDKRNKAIWFGIELEEDAKLIGFTFLNNIRWVDRTCNLGIVIGEIKYQGSGIGKKVMNLLVSYAFKSLNLRKITLEVRSDHAAALKLYEKLGFKQEGILKDQYFADSKYHDTLILSIFNDADRSGK